MKYELDIVGEVGSLTLYEKVYIRDMVELLLGFQCIDFTSVTLNPIEDKVDGSTE